MAAETAVNSSTQSIPHIIRDIIMFPIDLIVSYYRYIFDMSSFLLKTQVALGVICLVLGVIFCLITLHNEAKLKQESQERRSKYKEEAEAKKKEGRRREQ